jgi:hypothetical protein
VSSIILYVLLSAQLLKLEPWGRFQSRCPCCHSRLGNLTDVSECQGGVDARERMGTSFAKVDAWLQRCPETFHNCCEGYWIRTPGSFAATAPYSIVKAHGLQITRLRAGVKGLEIKFFSTTEGGWGPISLYEVKPIFRHWCGCQRICRLKMRLAQWPNGAVWFGRSRHFCEFSRTQQQTYGNLLKRGTMYNKGELA